MIRKSFAVVAALVLLGLLALGIRSWLEAHNDFVKMLPKELIQTGRELPCPKDRPLRFQKSRWPRCLSRI